MSLSTLMHLGGGGVSLLEVSGLIEDEIFEEKGLILFDSFRTVFSR